MKTATSNSFNARVTSFVAARREAVNLPAMPGQRVSPFGHLGSAAGAVLACEIKYTEAGLAFATGEIENEYVARTDSCVVRETLASERKAVCRYLGVALNTVRHQVSKWHTQAFVYPRTDDPEYYGKMLDIALAIAEAYFPANVHPDISFCGATPLDTAV